MHLTCDALPFVALRSSEEHASLDTRECGEHVLTFHVSSCVFDVSIMLYDIAVCDTLGGVYEVSRVKKNGTKCKVTCSYVFSLILVHITP